MSFRVHIMNPKRRRRRKANAKPKAKPRKAKATMQTNPRRRRRRRKNCETSAAPVSNPRRRRRRSARRRNPVSFGRRRRRRNPEGFGGGIMSEVNRFLPRLLGKLFVAFLVKRWGGQGSLMSPTAMQSPTLGGSWTMGQYVLAAVGAHLGAKVFGRFINAEQFKQGAYDLILTKLVWTEGLSRSPWLQATFGAAEGEVKYNEQTGQMEIFQGGRWQMMQGYDDMSGSDLVTASPLDGELVAASPLDGSASYGYGHLLPANADAATVRAGMYTGSGYVSPYHAAYSR